MKTFLLLLQLAIFSFSKGYDTLTWQSSKGSVCSRPSLRYRYQRHFSRIVSSTCLPGFPKPGCFSWRVNSVILLVNETTAEENLNDILQFLDSTTSSCNSNSEMQMFLPYVNDMKDECTIYKFGTTPLQNAKKNLNTAMAFPSKNRTPGDTLFDLLNSVNDCLNLYPKTIDAGILYVFTDISCEDFCASRSLSTSIPETLQNSVDAGFVVRFVLLNKTTTGCFGRMLFPCQLNDDLTFCELVSSDRITAESDVFKICIDRNPSFASATPDFHREGHLNQAGLILIIVLPCVCLTICCVGACIIFSQCVKARIEHMHAVLSGEMPMESLGNQRRFFKKWADFAKSHSVEEDSNLPTSSAANQYMEIRAIAEANKKDVWEIPQNNLLVHENHILGNGAFANVYKGTIIGKVPLFVVNNSLNLALERESDTQYEAAIKRLPAHADEQNHREFFHEIEFMKKLGYHTHVISMLGCVSNPFEPLIVVEYCEKGDLLKFLRRHKDCYQAHKDHDCHGEAEFCLRVKDLVSIAWQVTDGMSYLHSKNFIHRDLAARNILLTRNMTAKIGDFGLCRYADSALYTTRGGRFPIKWMALESLKLYEFSLKTDVWSFGVFLFELFTMGDVPYPTIQPTEMIDHLEAGNRLSQPTKCPNEIYELMKLTWSESPESRPEFNELRSEFTNMLNLEDESYGYLCLDESSQKSSLTLPQVSPTLSEQIKEDHKHLEHHHHHHCRERLPTIADDGVLLNILLEEAKVHKEGENSTKRIYDEDRTSANRLGAPTPLKRYKGVRRRKSSVSINGILDVAPVTILDKYVFSGPPLCVALCKQCSFLSTTLAHLERPDLVGHWRPLLSKIKALRVFTNVFWAIFASQASQQAEKPVWCGSTTARPPSVSLFAVSAFDAPTSF
ncbi:unnamed protein product [Caenorhabditis auriculariae]|uniref:Protein kinase domain-containing protein n=1 Tax=Caenorhabditis auriculariae TaxID=2777116 RepID=A0A8S1GP47_9PELO|nr:unnamed protein product [Caenorhabditis auriculariae]